MIGSLRMKRFHRLFLGFLLLASLPPNAWSSKKPIELGLIQIFAHSNNVFNQPVCLDCPIKARVTACDPEASCPPDGQPRDNGVYLQWTFNFPTEPFGEKIEGVCGSNEKTNYPRYSEPGIYAVAVKATDLGDDGIDCSETDTPVYSYRSGLCIYEFIDVEVTNRPYDPPEFAPGDTVDIAINIDSPCGVVGDFGYEVSYIDGDSMEVVPELTQTGGASSTGFSITVPENFWGAAMVVVVDRYDCTHRITEFNVPPCGPVTKCDSESEPDREELGCDPYVCTIEHQVEKLGAELHVHRPYIYSKNDGSTAGVGCTWSELCDWCQDLTVNEDTRTDGKEDDPNEGTIGCGRPCWEAEAACNRHRGLPDPPIPEDEDFDALVLDHWDIGAWWTKAELDDMEEDEFPLVTTVKLAVFQETSAAGKPMAEYCGQLFLGFSVFKIGSGYWTDLDEEYTEFVPGCPVPLPCLEE
jgi:hypothetical protein